jgi:hypothetical protein
MQRLEVSGAVRPLYGSLGFKGLNTSNGFAWWQHCGTCFWEVLLLLCFVLFCCVVLCFVVSCFVVSCYVLLLYVMFCYIVLYPLCYIIKLRNILYILPYL